MCSAAADDGRQRRLCTASDRARVKIGGGLKDADLRKDVPFGGLYDE